MPEGKPPAALLAHRQQIDEWVVDYFDQEARNTEGEPGDIAYAIDHYMAEFAARPAKRIRGALAMIGYDMFGGKDRDASLHIAGALEASQNYLLFLDDVMDRSPTRRGSLTMHMQFREYLEERGYRGNIDHVSNGLATVAGIVLAHKVNLLINNTPTDALTRLRLSEVYDRNMVMTGYGQAHDLINGTDDLATEQKILKMYGEKTGHYTIINPLQMGACLAGASPEDLEALREYGWHAGIAFQLRDDWLGMFGDEYETGKSVYSDLEEGKVTLLMHHVLQEAGEIDGALIQAVRGRRVHLADIDEVELDQLRVRHGYVRKILQRTRAERYVEQKAIEQGELAKAVLDRHPEWDPEGSLALRELIEYVLTRQS